MKKIPVKIRIAFVLAVVLAVFVLLGVRMQSSREVFTVHFIGMGDADAILLQYRGRVMLIDTGDEAHGNELVASLAKLEAKRLDALILTHPDKDHIGGAAAVLEQFGVDVVLKSPYHKGSSVEAELFDAIEAAGATAQTPTEPVRFVWEDASVTVYPPGPAQYISSNESSLITVVEHGAVRMVFAGDAQEERLKEMLELPVSACVLYKVPHHGRDSAMSKEVLIELAPQYAVITGKSAGPLVNEALLLTGTKVFFAYGQTVRATSDKQRVTMSYARIAA